MSSNIPRPSTGTPYVPIELIALIFEYLDVKTITRCRQVSPTLRDFIDHSASIQYRIELVVAGMADGPPSHLSPAERLDILKEHQKAWKHLDWKNIQLMRMFQTAWECLGGILAYLSDHNAFHRSVIVKQLPSVLRGIEERQWILTVDFGIEDFAMDPSQDLIMLIQVNPQFQVHPRSLSTGEPHPLACKALLADIGEFGICRIQILGSLVGVQHPMSGHLVVWNWLTGTMLMEFWGVTQAFSFLSEDLVIVGLSPPIGWVMPTLEIYNLHTAIMLCSLQFPLAREPEFSGYSRLMIRTDTTPGPTTPPSHNVPFSPSQTDRLYVVRCDSDSPSVPTLLLFVPLSTFIAQVDALDGETGRCFGWSEWGGGGTRMFHLNPSPIWITYVHGMKFAMIWKRQIKVFDFNQLSFKRDYLSRTGKRKFRPKLKSRMFSEPIYSSLECQLYATRLPNHLGLDPSHYESVLLTEDTLIAIPKSGFDNCAIFTF